MVVIEGRPNTVILLSPYLANCYFLTMINSVPPQYVADCCLARSDIPVELRVIIHTFMHVELNNQIIYEGVADWKADKTKALLKYGHVSTWNVSQITSMKGLFTDMQAFNEPLNDWDVSNVIDMNNMFYGATSFNQPLDQWDTSQVFDMNLMFYGTRSFNQSLDQWNVHNVHTMVGMFIFSITSDGYESYVLLCKSI